jgi:hypothetical protein
VTKLHPDFPDGEFPAEQPEYGYYNLPVPMGDLAHALDYPHSAQMNATPAPSPAARPVRVWDLAEVVRYYIEHNDVVWKPGDKNGGSELNLVVVARTKDGRWVSVEAWNDYTGWDCQDSSDVRIGGSEDQVVRFGLTESGRARLGYPLAGTTS